MADVGVGTFNENTIADYGGPLAGMEFKAGSNISESFPSELENSKKWLEISAFEYKKPTRATDSYVGQRFFTARLPLPDNLAPNYDQNYSQISQGYLGAYISGNMPTVSGITDAVGKNIAPLVEQLKGLESNFGKGNFGAALQDFLGVSQSLGMMVPDILKNSSTLAFLYGLDSISRRAENGSASALNIAGIGLGVAKNHNLAQIYEGPNFRAFNFSYNFFPKSVAEANTLKKLERMFKMAMSPSYSSGNADQLVSSLQGATSGISEDVASNKKIFDNLLYNYPLVFQLKFSEAVRPQLFNFAPTVLKSFSPNWHAEGKPYYADDSGKKYPAAVSFTFDFQEIAVITREDIASKDF